MHQTKTPQVNEVNEFLEIASDFEDPLEVIRESLSNSYDAGATEVYIAINQRPAGSEIVIEDDGHGMDPADLESFFDLGNSTKTDPADDSIGYKGHGTKIFYKSDEITVTTSNNGTSYRAEMRQPWQKLNDRILPEYEVTETDSRSENTGTRIRVTGFKSGHGFSPTSLTYNKIEHYLKWKTLAGSTAHFFEDDFRELSITVDLDASIDDSRTRLEMDNRLEFPPEQLEPGEGDFPAERMCKHFTPRELTVETDTGETTTIQVVGMIGGKDARNELPTFGKHSTQFGVWLAKDHIKVERLNEAISHDNEFLHFFFIANCQDLELSANREQIRNKSSPVYQAIEERLSYYLSKVSSDPWFKDYLAQRRIARLDRRAASQASSVSERKSAVTDRDRFVATNQMEVLLGLARSNRAGVKPAIEVEDFEPGSDINAIVRLHDRLQGASVHVCLTDHFEAEKPLENVSTIICWKVGDYDELRQLSRTGYLDGHLEFDFDNGLMTYQKRGHEHRINIVTVNSRLD